MNLRTLLIGAAAYSLLGPCVASAVDTSDDRISLSADGSTLSGTDGGGGAAAGWLHSFDADTLAGVAVEHQVLSVAHWTFGSLNGAWTVGPDGRRYTIYGDAHEGAGDDGSHAFHYRIEDAGVIGTFFHQLSAQVEDKRIDVESTHGNLPKLGLAYLWNPHLQTSVSYAYSVNGNLGTRLTSVRVDEYGPKVNFLAGGAYGPAAAAVLGIDFTVPVHELKEGYVGASKPLPRWRSEVTLVADYQDLSARGFSDSKRVTVTLSYIFHVGHQTTAQ